MTAALATDRLTLVELRCPHCGRVVAVYLPPIGLLRIRCKRCGEYVEVTDQAA